MDDLLTLPPPSELTRRIGRAWQCPDQVEFLPSLIRVNWGFLVMVDQLIQIQELPLPNAVVLSLHVDTEVLISSRSFQRHREVPSLKETFVSSQTESDSLVESYSKFPTYICFRVPNEEIPVVTPIIEQLITLGA